MANNLTPIVYDAASREHKPANVGDHLNPAFIAVDSGTGNLLQNRPDNGLRVEAADFVSPTAGNMLTAGADGKLYVGGGQGGAGMISTESGNYIRPGRTDGMVYVGGEDILSNDVSNVLHLDTSDRRRIVLTADDIKTAIGGGGSGSIETDVNQLKADMTVVKSDIGTVKTDVATNTRDIADLKQGIRDITIVSTDRNNVLTEGRDGGAYLAKQDIIDTVEDAGITGKVDVQQLINLGTDPLLSKAGDKLISGLSVQYNQLTGRLDILGVNGQSVANANIPSAVAMLDSVQIVDNPSGQPAGTYIHFKFRLTDGTTSDVYLNVNRLAQYYTAGDGISITTDGEISINRALVTTLAENAIDTELGTGGKIRTAINTGVSDALETQPIKDKIAAITEDAIKSGDVSIVSTDTGNVLTKGTDGGAMLTKTVIATTVNDEIAAKRIGLVSADASNLLKEGTDGRPYLDPDDVPSGVSTDAGNALRIGTDNKPYFPSDFGTL